MAIWIREYLTKNKTESSDDQTKYIDLPDAEQISQIDIEWRVTNTSTVNNLRSILDVISKIEVVADGVKTLFSATPEVASYLAFVAQNGVLPDHRFFDGASAVSRLHLPIFFGRYPGDEEYLLDTTPYKSVQLQITYSLNTTYEATGTTQHTITYLRPLTSLSPRGFIRSRRVKLETTTAAVQTVTHDLPMSYPWHLLGVRVDDRDQDINTDLTAVDVNIDSGRLHLLDVDADEIYYENFRKFRHANAYVSQPVVTGQETVHTFGEWAFPKGAVTVSGNRLAVVDNVAGEQCRITVYVADTGAQATDAIPIACEFPSPMPHKCMMLVDGRKQPFPADAYTEGKVDYDIAAYVIALETFVQEIITGTL